jgi:hypothetical protein
MTMVCLLRYVFSQILEECQCHVANLLYAFETTLYSPMQIFSMSTVDWRECHGKLTVQLE